MAKSPFKLKSGNSLLIKHMGGSPLKEDKFGQEFKELQPKAPYKKPVGPTTNDPNRRFFPDDKIGIEKPTTKPHPRAKVPEKTKEIKPITNTNVVSEPVTTNVNMPNPNLKVDDKSSDSTIGDVLQTIHAPWRNPNKTIKTTQNVVTKVKKKVGESYRKTKTI